MSNQIEEKKCSNTCYRMDNIGIDTTTSDFGCCLNQAMNTILTSWKTDEENILLPWYNNISSGNNNNGTSWLPEVNNGNNNSGTSWSPEEVNNGNNNSGTSWSPEEVNNGENNNNNNISLSGNNGNNNGTSWSPEKVVNNGSNSNTFKTTLKSKENELSTITKNVKPIVEKLWQTLSVHFLNIHDMKLPILFGLIVVIMFAIVFDVPIWKTLIVYAIVIVFLMMMNWKSIDKNVPEDAASVIKEHFGINQNTPIYIDEYNCVCQAPSPNNPCMNVLPYDNPYRPKGCNPTIPTIQERMNQYFYANPAFINPKDIFGLHNDLHQWIPLPGSTIPTDREAWMKDAYRGMCSCKVNQQRCVDRVSWDVRRP